jgi:hypothetical protein
MTFAAERELERIGTSRGMADHDHDLVHELSRRLDTMWRLDQYIANADWRDNLRQFWEELKQQEENNIRRMKQLLAEEIRNDCF